MNPISTMATSNCETSTIFAGGGPDIGGAEVKVGDTTLVPSPFINLAIEKFKMGDLTIGGILKLTLNGSVTGSSFNEVVAGAAGRTGIEAILALGKIKGCVHVMVQCSNQLINGYGRIISVSVPEGNNPTWVNIAPYSIEIEIYTNKGTRVVEPDKIASADSLSTLMLRNLSEQFSLSINEDAFNWGITTSADSGSGSGYGNRHLKLSFSMSGTGIRGLSACTGGSAETTYKYGLEAVEIYMLARIDKLRKMDIADILNAPALKTELQAYIAGTSLLEFRNIEINAVELSMTLTGDLIIRPSSCNHPNVFNSLTIEQSIDPEGENITLSGDIQGLIDTKFANNQLIKMTPDKFSDCVINEKMTNANTYLASFATLMNLTTIANLYYADTFDKNLGGTTTGGYLKDTCPLSATTETCGTSSSSSTATCPLRLINSQISRNISQGNITFNFVLSNRANCSVVGAKKIDIDITHDRPRDNIVEILIPGRGAKGVVTQNLCCKSADRYDISVNATLNSGACSFSQQASTISELRDCATKALAKLRTDNPEIDVSCWFLTNDQETIGNTTYKLNQSYTKPSCP